jgi:uncharacterized membrane protein YczE
MLPIEHTSEFLGISYKRWLKLLVGLVCFGTGITFMKQSQLGLSPWEVLHDGLSKVSGQQLGTVSIFIGVIVLLLWIPLREKPGIGTILNILIVGTVTNLTLPIIPAVDQVLAQSSWLTLGLLLIGLGSALYLGCRLGAGPRDGLMMALYHRTGWSIRVVRTILEVSVLAIGWRLGGTIGIGTLAFALGIGPIVQFMFRLTGDHEFASGRNRE